MIKPARKRILLALVLALPAAALAHGPWIGPGGDNVARVLFRILDPSQSFSATAVCRMESPHPGEYMECALQIAFRDGKLRCEVDSARIEAKPAKPADAVQRDQAMGITHTVVILQAGQPRLYLYPELQGYAEESPVDVSPGQVARKAVGAENVAGVEWVKNEVALSAAAEWGLRDIVTWDSAAFGDPPLRIQFSTEDGDAVIQFQDVDRSPPDESLFVPPAGYQGYPSIIDLIRAAGTRYYSRETPP